MLLLLQAEAAKLEAEGRAASAEERRQRLEAELEAREKSFRASAAEAEEQWRRRLESVQKGAANGKRGNGQQQQQEKGKENDPGADLLLIGPSISHARPAAAVNATAVNAKAPLPLMKPRADGMPGACVLVCCLRHQEQLRRSRRATGGATATSRRS